MPFACFTMLFYLGGDKDAFDRASSLADQLLGSGQQSVFSFRKKVVLLQMWLLFFCSQTGRICFFGDVKQRCLNM
jgi:hypothetical protein